MLIMFFGLPFRPYVARVPINIVGSERKVQINFALNLESYRMEQRSRLHPVWYKFDGYPLNPIPVGINRWGYN